MHYRSQFLISAFLFCLWGLVLARPLLYGQDFEYVQRAAKSAIFIYNAHTRPCASAEPGQSLMPIGTGFVVGIQSKNSGNKNWKGWKFLITAEHVVEGQTSVILRLNRTDEPEFTCFPISLVRNGKGQNVYTLDQPGVDLAAINIPDIPHTSPTIFVESFLLDRKKMKQLEVQVGTKVFTIGYLYGYSGEKENFPVTKFGRIALLTQERWFRSPRRIPLTLTDRQKQQIENATGIPAPNNIAIAPGILEQGYLVEMQATPGLSGAPVLLLSPQFRVVGKGQGQFQYRRIVPYVVGVIKDLLTAPSGGGAVGLTDVAVIEPASNLRLLINNIADKLKAAGFEVQSSEPAKKNGP